MKRIVVLGAYLLVGCAPDQPASPTWNDVKPILAANCVRCHTTGIGGAPTQFRLDRYEDSLIDELSVRGAKTMAPFIVARAVEAGTMPPIGPELSARQRDILAAWAAAGAPRGEPAQGRHAALVTGTIGAVDADGRVAIRVVLQDRDHEALEGELRAGDIVITDQLHTGAQTIVWDTGVVAPGSYAISVTVLGDDPRAELAPASTNNMTPLGEVVVSHDNTAPTVRFDSPTPDLLYADGENATAIIDVSDPDLGDALTLDLVAVRGRKTVVLAAGLHPARGLGTIPFTTTDLEEGPSWRLQATVFDGTNRRAVLSPVFVVSHSQTSETYASVKPVLDAVCAGCHDAKLIGPDMKDYASVRLFRGRAWRKVVPQLEMPPKSTPLIVAGGRNLTPEERARLGAWLFAGAPQ